MVPEAVRTGRGKGARTGVVRMLVIFMGRNTGGEMGLAWRSRIVAKTEHSFAHQLQQAASGKHYENEAHIMPEFQKKSLKC